MAGSVVAEGQRRAMGTDVHVVVVAGDSSLVDSAFARINDLEQLWSRFRPDSDISTLNRNAGRAVRVAPETVALFRYAIVAWTMTGGRFDPTVEAAMRAHGYDRDFGSIAEPVFAPTAIDRTPGLSGVEIDVAGLSVRLPRGVSFDPGGIGKGLAADMVVADLLAAGARGALVNVGGDLRAAGTPPAGDGWVVTVPDPVAGTEMLRFELADGAVATSSRLDRQWVTTGGPAHHLIDPKTGRPATTDIVAVTVIAAEAWRAEALTKLLFLGGPDGFGPELEAHAAISFSTGCHWFSSGLDEASR